MADGPDMSREGRRSDAGQSVESLANEALKVLAHSRGAKAKALSEKYVAHLRNAVVSSDFHDRHKVIASMRANSITVEDMIDRYIPEVARQLGDEWCVDQTSFVDVTIGAARLQGLLRELLENSDDRQLTANAPGVAVVVVADEFHTLGALVLTAQLRRIGVSVRLLLDSDPNDLLATVGKEDRFDAIMISASHIESLVQLAKFVDRLKKQLARGVPIVIGGPVLTAGVDVRAATGADFATSDVVEALRLCQLKISPHTDVDLEKVG